MSHPDLARQRGATLVEVMIAMLLMSFGVLAMTAIGLNTHLKQLLANGFKPILLGLACWLAVALVSLGLQQYLQLW